MSRSCQSATFSSPAIAPRADDTRQPADPLGDDRVPLVRHRRRSLLTGPEGLLDLAHLRPGEVADLEREPLERRREECERVQHLGMAVALEDLRGARSGLEPEALAGDPLDLGIGRGVGADGARELADPHSFERPGDARAVTLEREGPAGELETEGGGLGVDAVRAADRQGLAMLLGASNDGGEGAIDPREDQRAGIANLERERGVEDVRRRQAVVEPAPLFAEPLGDRVRRTQRRRGASAPRSPRRARASERRLARESRRSPRAARCRSPPSPPAPRARPPASAPASLRPTRSPTWPGGSSAESLERVYRPLRRISRARRMP